MDQENAVKEDLEKKISFSERARYAYVPAALTLGALYVPNVKRKYEKLPQKTRNAYSTVGLTGGVILTTAAALFFAYRLAIGKEQNTQQDR